MILIKSVCIIKFSWERRIPNKEKPHKMRKFNQRRRSTSDIHVDSQRVLSAYLE